MTTEATKSQTASGAAQAWLPEVLSQAEWDRGLRLGCAWRPLSFDVNRLSVKVKPGALVRHPEAAEKLIAIAARINAVAVEFVVARDEIFSLVRHIAPDLARLQVSDAAIAPLLDWITRATAPPAPQDFIDGNAALAASFESSKATESNEASLFLTVNIEPFRCLVGVRRITDAFIDDALTNWPIDKHVYGHAELAVQISCGYADLSPAEIQSLEVGDVIVADTSPGDIESRFLFAGASVYLWNHNLGQLTKLPFSNAARGAMSDDYEAFDYEEDFDAKDEPDGATTKVVFLAGVASVPLARLQAADVGYIFETNREAGSVDILVSGKKIGVGQLVQSESGVGVRITRLIEP